DPSVDLLGEEAQDMERAVQLATAAPARLEVLFLPRPGGRVHRQRQGGWRGYRGYRLSARSESARTSGWPRAAISMSDPSALDEAVDNAIAGQEHHGVAGGLPRSHFSLLSGISISSPIGWCGR